MDNQQASASKQKSIYLRKSIVARYVQCGPMLLVAAGSIYADDSVATTAPQMLMIPTDTQAVLIKAPCLLMSAKRPNVEIASIATGQVAIFTAPAAPYGPVSVEIKSGAVVPPAGQICAVTSTHEFVITDVQSNAPSTDVLAKAFTILMMAFVLALLLEQAFALLFNWRLVQEFLVGKAWRTPIMFAAALALAMQMNTDLITQLSDAYDTRKLHRSNALTWALTAAILAGGSVGVNRLLTGLGFRSQVRPDLAPLLDRTQAWLAIRVLGNSNGAKVCIEIDPAPPPGTPTLAASFASRSIRERLRELFFINNQRFPKSGGYLVSTETAYRIYLILPGNQQISIDGTSLAAVHTATSYKFASRAIVDLQIKV